MERLTDWIIRHRKLVILLFSGIAVICAVLFLFVQVNYNMTDYLPPEAQSTIALSLMEKEFDEPMPNASVMIRDVSLMEAMEYKARLAALPGVKMVMWLDDVVDIKMPLQMSGSDTVEGFYKDGNALFSVAIAKGQEKDTTQAIQELIGEENHVGGEAPDLASAQIATGAEVLNAFVILLPAILAILFLSTSSWLEPLLFLLTIGVSIVINMGTNLFLGEVSFMTNAISPILQLACSLDYGIFLLHSFAAHRENGLVPEDAMRRAMKESIVTVAASALTTLFGFLALMFMNFRIGADLGLNLAKGIVLSFLSAMLFLPALTLSMVKILDKAQHRSFMPSFAGIHKVIRKIAIPTIIAVAVLLVPTFLGQQRTGFVYGNEKAAPNSRTGVDRRIIEEEFGQSTVMAILVPRGDVYREEALCKEVQELPHVTGVVAYALTVGAAIPPEYLGTDITSQFYSENYARIVLYTDTPSEGDEAFQTVTDVQRIVEEYYGDEAYSLGQSANLYDMKIVVEEDNTLVNLIAVIAIFLVLVFSFRSAVLPFVLLLTIETGIWINLSIPYFTGTSIHFMGYLVLSTVQLGATVDYAILMTSNYLMNRKILPRKEAIHKTVGSSFKSILVSGATLAIAGFTLAFTSSNPSISDIGMLLGRGTLLSMLMVTCFLPAMLTLLDTPIGKTTWHANFLKEKKEER